MTTPQQPKAVSHLFMPGQTISAIIKQVNRFDVSKEEMVKLLSVYKKLNSDAVPKVGNRALIPVLARHHDEVFKPKEKKFSLL